MRDTLLFSPEMAFAACSGLKSVTRRLLRLPGAEPEPEPEQLGHGAYVLRPLRETDPCAKDGHWSFFLAHDRTQRVHNAPLIRGPILYRPVTMLTTWSVEPRYDDLPPSELPDNARENLWHAGMSKKKPDGYGRLRSGRFFPSKLYPCMPRIHIDTTASVERLQSITEQEARAEGVEPKPTYIDGFRIIFDRLNGPDKWAINPWVWRIPFKVA